DDTFAINGSAKVNGNSRYLFVGGRATSLLNFDLSLLPSGAHVTAARLRLFLMRYKGAPGSIDVSVHEVFDPWGEHGMSGRNMPGIDPASATTTLVDTGQRGDYVEWDVTQLVQAWLISPATAHGFALTSVGNPLLFCSQEGSPGPPQLVVQYDASGSGGGGVGPTGPTGPHGPAGSRGATPPAA